MFETFVHQFVDQMKSSPEKLALVCIEDDGTERQINRAEFLEAVQGQAWKLKSQGVDIGNIVLLVLPHGMELFSAFWGVLLLGAVPVVYAYPNALENQQIYLEQLKDFVLQIRNDVVLILPEFFEELADLLRGSGINIIQGGKENLEPRGNDLDASNVSSLEQTALLQFSSGTTGAKKGVMLSHRAIINYLAANVISMQLSPSDVIVSWLPLNHDMGLIACFIVPLTGGFPAVIMSPRRWITDPGSLFRAVHRYRGTITLMPNFAFSYCTKNVSDYELAGADLSSWLVINGAERVRREDLWAFSERFAVYGMQNLALRVGYGMAECVLGVSRTPLGSQPKVDWVDQQALLTDGKAISCEPNVPNAKVIVSCGRPHPMVEMEIVAETGLPLPERKVGEIRIQSTTLFSGYYLQPELTQSVLIDGWFYTGDLGYLSEGELYVCGRKKDVIITFGRNIYPEDIEGIAGSFPEVRRGRVVAFGVSNGEAGTEKIVLLCELRNDSEGVDFQLVNSIRKRVWQSLDVYISQVGFVERGWVVKTSSGKIARSANKEKYLAG
jgi:fatty-acyl-CoA synthase